MAAKHCKTDKILFIIAGLFYFVPLTRAQSTCSAEQWTCDDGTCIPLLQKCDGKEHCADKSDETAENCIHLYRECPDYAFKCSYGACITGKSKCDGHQDCADNSDEMYCSEEDNKKLRGKCRENEMQCLYSRECITEFSKCDGFPDCSDGSDEKVEVCGKFACSKVGFHCGYGGCISGNAECNGTVECPDGSDEAWELCDIPRKTLTTRVGPTLTNPKPTPPATPKPTPTDQPIPSLSGTQLGNSGGSCQLPVGIRGLQFKLHRLNETIQAGAMIEDDETVHLSCEDGFMLHGTNSLWCNNGKFNTKIPSCYRTCNGSLLHRLSTTYTCSRRGHDVEGERCEKNILPGTQMRVRCAYGYKRKYGDTRVHQDIECRQDGSFSEAREHCVIECGLVQQPVTATSVSGFKVRPDQLPWHVAVFREDEGKVKPICGGSIISPTMVVSAAHCFWDNARERAYPKEQYIFVAGTITRIYNDRSGENAQTRFPQAIYIDDIFRANRNNYLADIALIKVSKAFKFNDNISPVCMLEGGNGADDYVASDIAGTVAAYGDDDGLEKVPMTTEAFYGCRNHPGGDDLATDKFCLNNNQGAAVCAGDSGGGFVTKSGPVHSLLGIISFASNTQQAGKQDCAINQFVGASNVRYMKPALVRRKQQELENEISDY